MKDIDIEEFAKTLETFIMQYSLGSLVENIAGICITKAETSKDNSERIQWYRDSVSLARIEFKNPIDQRVWKS